MRRLPIAALLSASLSACSPSSSSSSSSSAPPGASGDPGLSVRYEVHSEKTTFHSALLKEHAPVLAWALLAQTAKTADALSLEQATVVVVAPTGSDEVVFDVPKAVLAGLPSDEPTFLTAAVLAPDGTLTTTPAVALLAGNVPCESLSFSFTAGEGDSLAPGTVVADQWSEAGIKVSALNHVPGHPDKALILDSSDPPPGDPDLQTPGYGPGNDTALGNLVIIAENDLDLDGDGLVDVPDDEAGGGVLTIELDEPATFCSLTIVDLENGTNVVRFFDAGGALLDTLDLPLKGDNSVQTLGKTVANVSRLEIDVHDSFGVSSLEFVFCPTRLRFDLETTGTPTGLEVGAILSDQLAGRGITLAAQSFGPHHVATLFDTTNPTGGDLNLADPEEGLVLIIAENVDDADFDGLIDDPDDEAAGGILTIAFDYDVRFLSGTVLDVDLGEVSWFELYDEGGTLLAIVPLASLGDGSKQTVEDDVEGVRRVELHLGGSGALAELVYCPQVLPGEG